MTDRLANTCRSLASSLTSWALVVLVLAAVSMSLVPCKRQFAGPKTRAVAVACCGAAHAACGQAVTNLTPPGPQSCPDCDGTCALRCRTATSFPLQSQAVARKSGQRIPVVCPWLDFQRPFRNDSSLEFPLREVAWTGPASSSACLWFCVFRC